MKKGFTLIELLAVIIVLGLLAVILYPTFDKMIKNNKEKLYEEQVTNIKHYASIWSEENSGELANTTVYSLSLDRLYRDGYITNDEITDPRTGTQMTGCVVIRWDESVKQYNFDYSEDCVIAYKDKSGANTPNLASNMIPVMWNGTNWVKADVNNEDETYYWYDYASFMWANAVTVTDTSRSNYKNAALGTVVNMSDILTMMVWIPRYEYRYDNLGTSYAGGTKDQPGEIEIKFVSGTKTTASASNYRIHPAFTFGTEGLTGFWMGKFETSGTITSECTDTSCTAANLNIIPNVRAYYNTITGSSNPVVSPNGRLSSMFYAVRSMSEVSTNKYGYDSSVDIHMAKNGEWGAVAYLSQSKYGKYGNPAYIGTNKEVYKNDSLMFNTGNSCGGPAGSGGACDTFTRDTTYAYNVEGSGTGASTTGTIYGVYDMVGGADDYVMGNYENNMSGSNFTSLPSDSKYYDIYSGDDIATACNGAACYGQALSETGGWYNDFEFLPTAHLAWFVRGGLYTVSSSHDESIGGIFAYDGTAASGNAYTMRIVHK